MRLLSQRFYKYVFLFQLTAGLWAGLQFFGFLPEVFTICPLKSIAGIPCPGCGTTRAGIAFLNGHFIEAFLINPVGLIVSVMMMLTAIMLVSDILTGRPHLRNLFLAGNSFLKKPAVFIPVVSIILLNWGWSINKAL
jgi:hypothetical protein